MSSRTIVAARVAAALLTAACASMAPKGPVRLEQVWRAEGLAEPESVALSQNGAYLYVSNVAGEGGAKDGAGFISRLDRNGKIVDREWVRGLNAPKGMAIAGGKLFVSDIDALVEIDATRAVVTSRTPVDGARFLNDVAIAPGGEVLVSDSGAARITVVANGVASTWLADPLLRSINGLLPERDRLVISTMQGKLLAVDWRTRAITVLAEGLGDGDGVAPLGRGRYLVSEWRGRIFQVSPDGTNAVLLDTRSANTLQNDFILIGDMLIVANMLPGTVTGWRVKR